MIKPFIILLICLGLFSCRDLSKKTVNEHVTMEIVKQTQDSTCSLEDTLINRGLVNVQSIDPRIKVNLRYSSINNFLRTDMYGCLNKAYFQNETAHKLAQAQEYLTVIDSNLSLLIWNGVRPRSIQRQMWNSLDMPFKEKVRYVSNPKNGSIHNYGCAVDLTICEQDGKLLDMGSDFDYFGPAANTNREYMLMTDSILNFIQFDNRKLLRTVMIRAGFSTISSEWWHFNWMSRYEASRKYAIIE